MRIGRIGKVLAPGWGGCLRCRTPWRFVPHHTTWYTPNRGCFPLCEKCWKELAYPRFRMPFYRELFDSWGSAHDQKWPQIETAVQDGK